MEKAEDTSGFPDNEQAIYEPYDRSRMVARVDESHERDYDGSRRIYADSVSTSQALVKRARANLNGHV